jgi:hypothetical protein
MSEGAGASEGTGQELGMDGGTDLDARGAAVIMWEAGQRARRELAVNQPAIFATWALVYLLGYGTVWLSVRGQQPYHAPAGWALGLLTLLAVLALVVTATVTGRATSGVGGVSAVRRRVYYLSLAAGWLGVVIMQIALRSAGASHGVIGVFTASAPLLVAGVVLVAGTAAWLNWWAAALGGWLIAVAALSGFAGPAGTWAVDALAVGLPFLVMAGLRLIRR